MFAETKLEIAGNMTRTGAYCLAVFLVVTIVILQLGIDKHKLDKKQSEDYGLPIHKI